MIVAVGHLHMLLFREQPEEHDIVKAQAQMHAKAIYMN